MELLTFPTAVELRFLNGHFEIDGKAKMVSFTFNSSTMSVMNVVPIEKVIDSHSVEIAKEDDVRESYIEQKNMAYQDCDHQMWKLTSSSLLLLMSLGYFAYSYLELYEHCRNEKCTGKSAGLCWSLQCLTVSLHPLLP